MKCTFMKRRELLEFFTYLPQSLRYRLYFWQNGSWTPCIVSELQISFPGLYKHIKILLFRNHWSERGTFTTTDVRNILYRINFKREHLKNFCKRSQKCNHLNWMKQLVNCLLLGISNTCDWKKRRVFHIQPHTYRK